MQNNKLLLKIYCILLSICILSLIILSILGNKNRKGYLSDFVFDENHINKTLELNGLNITETKNLFIKDAILDNDALTNYIFTNESIKNYSYGFRIKYYSKVFRNSDIYGVYIDTNKIIQDNDFIKEIKMNNEGSPFGNLISSKKINENIDNINYTLKLKSDVIIISSIIIILIILFIIILIFNKQIIKILSEKVYIENKIEKHNNILFIIFLIFLSIIILSSSFILQFKWDDWKYTVDYRVWYHIFDFTGDFWQRGRHFGDILMSLHMKPLGNILVGFGMEPYTVHKVLRSLFTLIYSALLSVSISYFIWILNNKKNYKLIVVIVSLYISLLSVFEIKDYIYMASYIGSGGICLLLWMPIFYYFVYDKEIALFNNKLLYYISYLFIIYFISFSIEPVSLLLSGISFFIILYLIFIEKKENFSSTKKLYLFFMILIILTSFISLLVTINSGRGQWQLDMVNDTSIIQNIKGYFSSLNIFSKLIINLGIIYIIYSLFLFIRNRNIKDKYNYIKFITILVSVIGIFGFYAIRTHTVWIEILMIFSILISAIIKNLESEYLFRKIISYFTVISLIFFMTFQLLINYDNFFNENLNNDSAKKLINLFIEADKKNLNAVILKRQQIIDNKLEIQDIKKYPWEWPNVDISKWMLKYGYTKKYIEISIED